MLAHPSYCHGTGPWAVDKRFQSRRVDSGLLHDAVLRTIQAADIAGIRAILVHAISEVVIRFYPRYGIILSPIDPMTAMIAVAEARRMLCKRAPS